MRLLRWFYFVGIGVLAAPLTSAATQSEETTLRVHLDGLREIRVPAKDEQAKYAELNRRMDAAWTFVEAHKSMALRIVEAELKKAVDAPVPDQFFLMDMGNLLVVHRGRDGAALALSAVARLDPKSDIIRANWVELFHLMMKLGATGVEPERYLVEADRIYLKSEEGVNFFAAPHMVQLNGADVRCMVYGIAGEPAAAHLAALLSRAAINPNDVIPTLAAIGSEANVPQVAVLMTAARDFKTVAGCINCLMRVGGPSGRLAVLALDVRPCDAATQEYYKKIRPEVEKVSFPALVALLESIDKTPASDARLQGLLDAMEAHDGADHETPPAALLKSGIPAGKMLAQLKRIRTRSFRRETNHVFEDLQMTNVLINSLQFKVVKS